MTSPVEGLKRVAGALAIEAAALKSAGLRNTKDAVEAGALRISDEDRKATVAEAAANVNSKSTTPAQVADGQTSNYVTPKTPSKEHFELIDGLTEDGIAGKFTFKPWVVNQNIYEGRPMKGAGWKAVDPNVWIKLLQVIEQTGDEYVVSSAYRHPEHPEEKKKAKPGLHNDGKAIDIIIPDSLSAKEAFIVAASRAGFKGIGVYSTFIHIDLGTRRFWTAGASSSFTLAGNQRNRIESLLMKHKTNKLIVA